MMLKDGNEYGSVYECEKKWSFEENQERTVSKEKFHHSKVPVVLNISIGQTW